MDIVTTVPLCAQLITCAYASPLGVTYNQMLVSSASTPAPLFVAGPSFPPVTQGPISMLPGPPISLQWAPGMLPAPYRAIESVSEPPAPYNAIYSAGALPYSDWEPPAPCSAMQSTGVPHSCTFQPMTGMQWPQPTPYVSPIMAPPAWPIYLPSYMPRPLTQLHFLHAHFEELARWNQDMEARELEIQCISRSLNLKAVKNARTRLATSARGNKSTQLASQQSQTPSGLPPQGSKLFLRLWGPYSQSGGV